MKKPRKDFLEEKIRKRIKKKLKGSACHKINIVFLNQQEMEEINYSYLGREGATSVISFPYDVDENGGVYAEIFFCPDYIYRQVESEGDLDAYVEKLVEHALRSIKIA